MKAKVTILILLVAFLLPSVFAADLNITIDTLQATHNAANSGTFTLQNLNSSFSVTNLNCTITVGSWNTSVSCPTSLSANGTSTVSYSVTVPQYAAAGSYTGSVFAQGTTNGATYNNATQSFNTNVTNSPSLSITWVTVPSSVYAGQNQSVAINVSNPGNIAFSSVFINVTGTNASYSAAPISMATGASALWYMNVTTNKTTNYGSNGVYVTATGISGTVSATATSSSSFDVMYRYCSTNSSDERIRVYEITNEEDIDSQEFSPLDELIIKVKIRNEYDKKRTAVVNAILVHETSKIEETEVEKSVDVSSENYKTVNLNMTIPVNAEEGAYLLYVKAYDDDSSRFCDQEYLKFRIEKSDTHRVIPYDVKINQENVSCASSFIVSGKIGNIGSYDEEKVRVDYSDGWTTVSKTYSLDEGDETDFEFTSTAPKNATEGVHTFTLTTYYNYDDDDNHYEKSYANSYYSLLNIYGNCFKDISNASITPETASTQVFAGSQSELKILVSNTGTVKQTYTIDVPSVDWATVNSISPASFELEAGASRYVSIGITPSTNATIGNHTISAKVSYAGTSQTKSFTLNLQKVSQTGGLIEKIKFDVSRDWTWYLIGAFVIIIIWLIVAISSSANKSKSLEKALNEKKIKQYKNY